MRARCGLGVRRVLRRAVRSDRVDAAAPPIAKAVLLALALASADLALGACWAVCLDVGAAPRRRRHRLHEHASGISAVWSARSWSGSPSIAGSRGLAVLRHGRGLRPAARWRGWRSIRGSRLVAEERNQRERIHPRPVDSDGPVQVRTSDSARGADLAEIAPVCDDVAFVGRDAGQVRKQREQPQPMVDDHRVAVKYCEPAKTTRPALGALTGRPTAEKIGAAVRAPWLTVQHAPRSESAVGRVQYREINGPVQSLPTLPPRCDSSSACPVRSA